MADEFGEKTEAPTLRRREEAREEGNLAKSQDLTAGIMLLGAVLMLLAFAETILSSMMMLVETMLGGTMWAEPTRTGDVGASWAVAMHLTLQILIPIALGLVVIALVAGVMQVGFLVTYQPLAPKFSKLSPIKGIQQIVGMRGLIRLIMSLLKVAIVVGVAGISIYFDFPRMISLMHLEAGPLLAAGHQR
ncbi:MAG: EscU/YscU/HrcU family type III secretion system export apparatus switch protein, partial [Phycisphaeraceae bacterium]